MRNESKGKIESSSSDRKQCNNKILYLRAGSAHWHFTLLTFTAAFNTNWLETRNTTNAMSFSETL